MKAVQGSRMVPAIFIGRDTQDFVFTEQEAAQLVAGSTGEIVAVCIGKFRKFFSANRPVLFQ